MASTGFRILLLFLIISSRGSVSQISLDATLEDAKEFFTKRVGELSTTELHGFPNTSWKPLDPFELQYGSDWFNVWDPLSQGIYGFALRGSMTGASNFVVNDVIVTQEIHNVTRVNFTVTTGPITMKGRYIVTLNDQESLIYEGTFELRADSATRTSEIEVSVWEYDGSYLVNYYGCNWFYTSVQNYSLTISDLPENLTQVLDAVPSVEVLNKVSFYYFMQETYLFNDMIRHPGTTNDIGIHPLQEISPISRTQARSPEMIGNNKETKKVQDLSLTELASFPDGTKQENHLGINLLKKSEELSSGRRTKSPEMLGDTTEFFTKKVQLLSSTELAGLPITDWETIDPVKFLYYHNTFWAPGPRPEDGVLFYVMGSLSGSSNFTAGNIQVNENPNHSVYITFTAFTGPIHLTARFFAFEEVKYENAKIHEGNFELTAYAAERSEQFDIGVAPDGSYFVKLLESRLSYSSVTNVSLNFTGLPTHLVYLVENMPPEAILNYISPDTYFNKKMYLFNDMIRYQP